MIKLIMTKMLKKLQKNKKGVTMMEIVVGMMLFGMVVLTISAAIAPLMMAYSRANDLAEYNQILDSIGNRIVAEMAKSSEIEILPDGDVILTVNNIVQHYTLDNGLLQLNGDPVYQIEFYKGKVIAFTITEPPAGSSNYYLNLSVRPAGAAAAGAERSYAVKPLLMG